MISRHNNLPTDQELILGAQTRLVRLLESLRQREIEVEDLRERVFRLASQLHAAEALLDDVYRAPSAVSVHQVKAKIFEYFND